MAEDAPAAEPAVFEVWPENWESFALFASFETQWVVDGMSGKYLGLRYEGVIAELNLTRPADAARLFADIKVMERAARKVLNA